MVKRKLKHGSSNCLSRGSPRSSERPELPPRTESAWSSLEGQVRRTFPPRHLPNRPEADLDEQQNHPPSRTGPPVRAAQEVPERFTRAAERAEGWVRKLVATAVTTVDPVLLHRPPWRSHLCLKERAGAGALEDGRLAAPAEARQPRACPLAAQAGLARHPRAQRCLQLVTHRKKIL